MRFSELSFPNAIVFFVGSEVSSIRDAVVDRFGMNAQCLHEYVDVASPVPGAAAFPDWDFRVYWLLPSGSCYILVHHFTFAYLSRPATDTCRSIGCDMKRQMFAPTGPIVQIYMYNLFNYPYIYSRPCSHCGSNSNSRIIRISLLSIARYQVYWVMLCTYVLPYGYVAMIENPFVTHVLFSSSLLWPLR